MSLSTQYIQLFNKQIEIYQACIQHKKTYLLSLIWIMSKDGAILGKKAPKFLFFYFFIFFLFLQIGYLDLFERI